MAEYMKYVIFRSGSFDREIAFLFHHNTSHDYVAASLYGIERVISAGFCYISKGGEVRVFGKSDSLNKESREDKDPEIIRETISPRKTFDDMPKNPTNIFDKKVEE